MNAGSPIRDGGWRERLRSARAIFGAGAWRWGGVIVLSGLAAFAFDLLFALSLQRLLAAIGLIAAAPVLPVLGPARGPEAEAALFFAAGLARVAAAWLGGYATGRCHVACEEAQRRHVVRWALESGNAALGKVTTLYNDTALGAAAGFANIFYIAGRGVLLCGTFLALTVYSPALTLMLAAVLIVAAPIQRRIEREIGGVSQSIQQSLAESVDRLLAGVKNSVFLQMHGLSGREIERTVGLVGTYARGSSKYYAAASSRAAIPQVLGLVVVVVVLLFGSQLMGAEKSGIVAYIYLALRFFQSLSEVAKVAANLRLSWPRLASVLNWWANEAAPALRLLPAAPEPRAEALTAPAGWRLDGVTFGWDAERPVLKNVDLAIAPGSAVVVLGPSGVGKTTFLLLLAGLLRPSAGSVRVMLPEGEAALAGVQARVLASTSYVGPDPFVVPGTIRDFLALGLTMPATDDAMRAALRRVHCDFVLELPRGLDHMLSEQGGGLSAGQKQRLALARALLRQPRILLLDEATANLDAEAERAIVSALREMKGSMTIVAATHREALKEIADQVVVLDFLDPGEGGADPALARPAPFPPGPPAGGGAPDSLLMPPVAQAAARGIPPR